MKDFKFIPSYDIDIAYSYKYKGLNATWVDFSGQPSKENGSICWIAGMCYLIKKKIPLIPMNGLIPCTSIAERGRIIFFFLRKNKPVLIKIFLLQNSELRSLIAYHAGGYTVGIHPSWQSGDEEAILMEEVDELEKITKVTCKIQPPALYPDEYYRKLTAS